MQQQSKGQNQKPVEEEEKKQEVQQLPKVEVNVLRRKVAVTSVANSCYKNIGILRNQSGEVLYACYGGSEEIQFLNKDNG